MSTSIDTLFSQNLKVSHAAHSLNSIDRQKIGIQAIEGNTPILHVSNNGGELQLKKPLRRRMLKVLQRHALNLLESRTATRHQFAELVRAVKINSASLI